MSQPGEIEDLTRALRRDLERAWDLIVAEQTAIAASWPTSPAAVREHRLALFQVQVLTLMDEVDAQAATTITRAMTTAYETGAWVTAISGLTEPTFTGISSAAITGLAQTTMDDLLTATSGVRESTKALIRELTRDQVINVLYTGVTPTDAARDLRRLLEKHQIHAVTYADGKRVGLAQYAEMVLRTKTAEAYQAGGLDQGEALGWDWWEIMDGVGCGWSNHEDPQKANGMIVDLETARAHPLSHPNCVMPGATVGYYGGAEQIVRAWFEGPSVTLTWRSPTGLHSTTVGPNHPVLTGRGWVKASLVDEHDQLVHDAHAPLAIPRDAREANLEQAPATVAESFEAMRSVGTHARVPATSDDLHGDAVFCQGEVDVVDVDRVLLGEADATFLKHPFEGDLVWTDVVPVAEVAGGAFEQLLTGAALAAHGVVCGCDAAHPGLGGETGRGDAVRFRDGSGEAVPAESAAYRDRIEADAGRDLPGGELLVDVEVDEGFERDAGSGHRFHLCDVVSVEVGRYSGWVYDASTVGGAFAVDGLVVRNCRRASTPRPDIASAREAAVALPTSPEALAEIQARAVAAQAATRSTLPAPTGVAKTATVATPARAVTAATLARPVTQAS